LRQAKKLGLLALSVFVLVAAVGAIAGMRTTPAAQAQVATPKTCTGVPGGVLVPGGTVQCVVVTTSPINVATILLAVPALPATQGPLQITINNPAGASLTGVTATG
jgi:hypothetical protein